MKIPRINPGVLCLLLLWAAIAVLIMWSCSCGGTFTLSPTGVVSYTTPKLITPQIQPTK